MRADDERPCIPDREQSSHPPYQHPDDRTFDAMMEVAWAITAGALVGILGALVLKWVSGL